MEVSSGINEVDGMNGYTEQGTKVKENQMHKETLFSLRYARACPKYTNMWWLGGGGKGSIPTGLTEISPIRLCLRV